MLKIYTRRSGMLAMKPERIEIAAREGVVVLEFGEPMPLGGLLLADCRPMNFKGGRTSSDPAATAIYVGGTFDNRISVHRFGSFDRALRKAMRLAASAA